MKTVLFKIIILSVFSFFFLSPSALAAVINKPTNYLGMVGYWTFDGKDMTPNVRDMSGQGNHGFLSGYVSTTTALGKVGQALQFDGVDDYVDIPDIVEGLSSITASFWMKASDISGNQLTIIKQSGGGADPIVIDYAQGTGGNDYKYRCVIDNGTVTANSGYSSAYQDNNWHHVVCVYNGVDIRLYVDGVLDVTPVAQTGTLASTANNLVLSNDSSGRMNGSLDEFRIYNRALSASEVTKLYNVGGSKFNKSPTSKVTSGLAGHWTFDGKNMVPNVRDVSGSGNHGNLLGQTSTTTVAGKVGQALSFDGVDDIITTGSDFIGTGADSVSVWVKKRTGSATVGTVVNNNRFVIRSASSGRIQFQCDGGTNKFSASSVTVLDTWQHWVVTRDAAGIANVYVDGVLSGTQDETCGTPAAGTANVMIGSDFADYWGGALDDVRIYNRALSASEAKQLYNEGAATKINKTPAKVTNSLIGHWTFDGKDMTPNVRDVSGQGNHGNIIGQTSTTTTIGKIGQALQLDGSDDYVNFGDVSALDFDGTQSVAFSIWYRSVAQHSATLIGKKANSGSPTAGFMIEIEDNWIRVILGDGSTAFNTGILGGNTHDNRWHHAVGVIDRATNIATMYLDGAAISTVDITSMGSLVSSTSFILGAAGNLGGKFIGSIDDARVYNRSLSANEITKLYNLGR